MTGVLNIFDVIELNYTSNSGNINYRIEKYDC